MKMTLRFCSTFAAAFALIFAAHAQQNPAPAVPVPDAPAPAASATNAIAPVSAEAASTNAAKSEVKPKAKKKVSTKVAPKKKTTSQAVKKPAAAAAASDSLASSVTRTEVNPPETGTVKQDAVNVRGRPSFIGEVITKLKKGENVTVLEDITLSKPKKDEPSKWLKIALPNNTPVWVFAEYIDANKTVIPNKLNLRAGPGENFSPIGIMKKGEVVKDLRKVNDWIEIEAPTGAFAFISAEFIDRKGAAPTPEIAATAPPVTPEPEKPVETATVPAPEEAPKVATEPVEPAKPAEPVVAPAPAPAEPAPAPVPQEIIVKRVVKREGTLKRAINIQAPTDYRLEGLDGKETINYVTSPEEQKMDEKTKKMVTVHKIDLKPYIGKRVIITGEEAMDRRWALTPILTIETIDLEQ